MLETNIRVVRPGMNIYVWTRQATISGPNLTPMLIEKSCGVIRNRYHLAAIPHPEKPNNLLFASYSPIIPLHLDGEDWELDVIDAEQPPQKILLTSREGEKSIPVLVERAFIAHIASKKNLWTIDSPRIWYEAEPVYIEDGIAAYRRFEIGSLFIKGIGVGIAVDTGIAFFSNETLAYYFDSKISREERLLREKTFMHLVRRQDGQKGTLVYDNGRNRTKCYFVSPPQGMTCANTGSLRIKGQSFDSLFDYYKATNPSLSVERDTLAVRVSFLNMEHPQPVAADRVRARIMNESLPDSLNDIDKIAPTDRRRILIDFWNNIGSKPLGNIAPGFENDFWCPPNEQIVQLTIPDILFGNNTKLSSPKIFSEEEYANHFKQRSQLLKKAGCYHVPPNVSRTVYCAYPNSLGEQVAKQVATDIATELNRLTGKPIVSQLVGFDSVGDAVEQLRDLEQSGMVVFILNEEPTAYYEAEFQLPGWRIKRITRPTLEEHYKYLVNGIWDRKKRSVSLEIGRNRWSGFINMVTLDVIQLLDVTPYRIDNLGPYEANLIIDVGYDRRFFAVSLLIARALDKNPSFRLISHTQHKVDHKEEAVNPIILSDEIIALFSRLPKKIEPLQSLLIMRDGKLVKQEPDGLINAVKKLKDKGFLTQDAQVDWVDIRKDTLKVIRLWNIDQNGIADNPFMGTGVKLNERMIIMVNTGFPTLKQATADPLLIVTNGHCDNVINAAQANFSGAQMNWSSPKVAQRLHIGMKRTDEDLKSRSAQEIRHLK